MLYKAKIDVTAKMFLDDDRTTFEKIKKESIVRVEWLGQSKVEFKTEDERYFQMFLNEFLFAFVKMELVTGDKPAYDKSGFEYREIFEELREVK